MSVAYRVDHGNTVILSSALQGWSFQVFIIGIKIRSYSTAIELRCRTATSCTEIVMYCIAVSHES